MSSSSAAKKPGVNLMRFFLVNFFSFFLASIVGLLAIHFIGLNLSLVLGGVSFIVLYIFISQIILKSSLKRGSLEMIGKSKLGVPIYEIDDQIANALAVGFWKYFGYIIVSTGLVGLLNELEFSEIINHEDNHLHQMHNLTIIIIPGMLTLIVWLPIVSIALYTPVILVFAYVMIVLFGLILSRMLSRSIETLADKTSDPAGLSSALMKIEEHNKVVRKVVNRATGSWRRLFSSHPSSGERPKKSSPIKDASIAGMYVSFLVSVGVATRILLTSEFSSFLVVFVISLILSVTILGSGFVVIEYLFISNLMGVFSKRFGVKSFYSIYALNGIIALLVVSAIPIITGETNQAILNVFIISSLVVAVVTTAIGTKPFKKGILTSALVWLLNSGIILIAFLILSQIILLGA